MNFDFSLSQGRIIALGYEIPLGDATIIPLVVGYCISSSCLVVVNKYAIDAFPFPTLLTALQYVVCVVAVMGLGYFKVLEHHPLEWTMLSRYFPAAFVFALAVFTNASLLKYATVDTFIVFRSSTPLLVAVSDTIFRNEPLPSLPTFGALGTILLGAIFYVITDSKFSVRAYSWAAAYLFTITFEMVYIKHILKELGMNTWSFVLYNNFLSLIIEPAFFLITGEFIEFEPQNFGKYLGWDIVLPVLLSCVLGLSISFFGFATRNAISATAFTVLGVTNKLLTVVINVSIWNKHASPFGIMCLLLTIFGGVAYQQTVVKGSSPPPKSVRLPPPPAEKQAASTKESTDVFKLDDDVGEDVDGEEKKPLLTNGGHVQMTSDLEASKGRSTS